MPSFEINKYKDVFTISNTDAVSLTYDSDRLNGCYNYVDVENGTIDIAGSVELTTTVDGQYRIQIGDGVDTDEATLKVYTDLLSSIVDDVYTIICGCNCTACSSSCANNCDNQLTLVLKILSYVSLTYPQYSLSLEKINEVIKCLLGIDISCLLASEQVTGTSDNSSLLKKIISLYYLSFYFLELIQAADEEEEDYVKEKYNFDNISTCISKLGIDIEEVEEVINNNMGNLQITSQAYVNQPPDNVGDNAISVANRAITVLTLAMFTTQTTPAYSDPENDPVDALRVDSLPADGTLKLNGVACSIGQVIDVADINSNLFTYESPDQDPQDIDDFDFSLRDTGSLQWSS